MAKTLVCEEKRTYSLSMRVIKKKIHCRYNICMLTEVKHSLIIYTAFENNKVKMTVDGVSVSR